MTIANIRDGECYFNFHKGLWETFPGHWALRDYETNPAWVTIGFPFATALTRGVPRYI